MRVWRLEKGRYELAIGPDLNDDGEIDEPQTASHDVRELRRFSTIDLETPARQNMVLTITQKERLTQPETLPDLALSPKEIQTRDDGTIEVIVHNIGAAPARNITVAIVDRRDEVLASRKIDFLDSPVTTLAAQRVTVAFDMAAITEGFAIAADPENTIEEILEENNRIRLTE